MLGFIFRSRCPKYDGPPISREVAQAAVRCHYLCHSLCCLRYDTSYARWEENCYAYDNGSGGLIALGWDPLGLVVVAHTHRSERNLAASDEYLDDANYQDDAEFLPGFPEQLRPLLESTTRAMQSTRGFRFDESIVTAGLWIMGQGKPTLGESWNSAQAHGLAYLGDILSSPSELAHSMGLTPAQVAFANGLLARKQPAQLTEEELAAAFEGIPQPAAERREAFLRVLEALSVTVVPNR